jgi:hypothetical protein
MQWINGKIVYNRIDSVRRNPFVSSCRKYTFFIEGHCNHRLKVFAMLCLHHAGVSPVLLLPKWLER